MSFGKEKLSGVPILKRIFDRLGGRPEDDPTVVELEPVLSRLRQGTIIAGRYRIEAYLAEGGMGQVYRAHDVALDVPLALKMIRPEIAANPVSLRRFKQEVLLARSVSHPNVCRIFDLGRDDAADVSFLTMEYLPGETLADRLAEEGALDPTVSLPLIRQMAEALDSAHRAGVVHRDFKSSNVMLVPSDEGHRAVITDFGLALAIRSEQFLPNTQRWDLPTERLPATAGEFGTDAERDESDDVAPERTDATRDMKAVNIPGRIAPPLSEAGQIVGTPAYMSPEQVLGRPIGPASDLYSLGVVLFEMVTGRLPFRAATAGEMATAHVRNAPPSPCEFGPVDPAWERTILRLLSKDPNERFVRASDVVLGLDGGLSSPDGEQHSLPAERDAFVGRSQELKTLVDQLEGSGEEATRLLTLQGPGGTGKTRLVTRYGWMSLSRWPGGVWFCDLSEASGADGICQAVAMALNVPLGPEDPVVQLGHALAGRGRCLLVLDNFEQVVADAEATVGRWLKRAPEARFLVTSQERLKLHGESVADVAPLDPTTQGVELFEARAQEHRPGFVVDDTNRNLLENIVNRLDGLPLAIELAASRLHVLTLQQLHDRLEDRLKVLAGGRRGRHETMQATLDWSWQLLEPWERTALAQASVFDGGMTLEAAEAVIDFSEFADPPLVLDVLQSLVNKSWLRTQVTLGAPRFDSYSIVQEFAASKLADLETELMADSLGAQSLIHEVRTRHGDYYAKMGTRESIASLDRHGGLEKRAALHLELDNLVSACQRAIARDDGDTATVAYLAAAAVLKLRGPFSQSVQLGRDVLEYVQEPAQRRRVLHDLSIVERYSGNMVEAIECQGAALALAIASGDRHAEGAALGWLGRLCYDQGRMEEARIRFDESISLAREIGDRPSEGVVLCHLGMLDRAQGKMVEAQDEYESALGIAREIGDRRAEGDLLGSLAILHRERGRMNEALAHYEQALAIARELGDRSLEGSVLGNLGVLHHKQGRLEEVRVHHEQALSIARETGDRRLEGMALGNLGDLRQGQGRTAEACAYYEQTLAIVRELGNRRFEGQALSALGNLHHDEGRLDEARAYYEKALAIGREVGNRRSEGNILGDLGDLHRGLGRPELAREHYESALAIHRAVGNRRLEGYTIGSLGELDCEQGQVESAESHYETALAIARELEDRAAEGDLLGKLGALCAELGQSEKARTFFDDGAALLRETDANTALASILCKRGCVESARIENDAAARAALAEAEDIAESLSVSGDSDLGREIAELRARLGRG